jgi:hypothetical protein
MSNFLSKNNINLFKVETKITFNVPANTKKPPFDYFTGRGRELRKKAAENEVFLHLFSFPIPNIQNSQKDKAQQILLSFESIAYYIMASSTLSGSGGDKLHQSIADNSNRIKYGLF